MKLKIKLPLIAVIATIGFFVNAKDIKIAYRTDAVSMDPMEQSSGGSKQMGHLVFDPLIRRDKNLNYVPRLATSWEQLNKTTTRFNLRKGVKFHSGNEMTADDVVWSLNRIKDSPDYKAQFKPYLKAKKIDNYTVNLITKSPYPLVLADAATLFIMDSKFYSGKTENGEDKGAVNKDKKTFAAENVSGTGPFTLESRQQGVINVFKKNPNYWGKTGNIETLTWVPIKENATRLAALLSGDIDVISPVAPTDLDRVKEADGINLLTMPSDRVITMQLNQEVVPQFKDRRVREAVIYAINNEGIAKKIMRGFATPAGQLSPKGYISYDESLKPRFNLKKAKTLMKEAGYEDGFSITMIAPNNRYVNDEKIAQAVIAMLAKINIKVNLTTMPKAQYWPEFVKCAAGISMIGWSSSTGDSANYSEYLTMTKNTETGRGQFNCVYSNEELNMTIDKANVEMDPKKRKELLIKASSIEYNDAAFIPLHWQNLSFGVNERITNLGDFVNAKNHPYFGDVIVKD